MQLSRSFVQRFLRFSAPQNLSGYVTFSGPKRVVDPDFAEMAPTGFRDQSSLGLFRKDGKVRAKVRAKVMESKFSGERMRLIR